MGEVGSYPEPVTPEPLRDSLRGFRPVGWFGGGAGPTSFAVRAEDFQVETFRSGSSWTMKVSCLACGWSSTAGPKESGELETRQLLFGGHRTHLLGGVTSQDASS